MRGLTRKQVRDWADSLAPVEVLALVYIYAGVQKQKLHAVVPAGVLEALRDRGLIMQVRGRWTLARAPMREPADPRIGRLLRVWAALYERAHCVPPPQSQYGPAAAVLKRVLAELERLGYGDGSDEVLRKGLERYFETTNRFIIENLHAIGLFHRYWQRYCGLAKVGETQPKQQTPATPAPGPIDEVTLL